MKTDTYQTIADFGMGFFVGFLILLCIVIVLGSQDSFTIIYLVIHFILAISMVLYGSIMVHIHNDRIGEKH